MTKIEMLEKAKTLLSEADKNCPKSCVSKSHSNLRQARDLLSAVINQEAHNDRP
jgi:hypothetical protein